jgi:hypothetical protein
MMTYDFGEISMQSEKRVVTHQDDDVLYRRPMDQLSDLELFSVIQYATRIRPSLEEAIRRADSNPDFLKAMFEFGDSRNENFGAKFPEWFNSSLPGCAKLNATMVSKIANNDLFKDRAKEFIPQDLRSFFSYDCTREKKWYTIISYLTDIEKPEVVFSAFKGTMTPVILAMQYLADHQRHEELCHAIHQYLEKHAIQDGPIVNNFASGQPRETLKFLVGVFLEKQEFELDQLAFIARTFTCLESANFKRPEDSGKSAISTLMSSGLLEDEVITATLKKHVSKPGFDPLSLIPEVTNRRSMNIISNFVSEKDLMKHGGRKVRGLLLENGLGL